jgi:glycosyltransferase involved in cell wall biosynthesis
MRIVLVNWARIWDGASFGGGVNQYCQALALELVRAGHDVISLFSGTTYVGDPAGCFIRRNDDWMGVRVFEVINSPVMAPSIVQFQKPLGEVSSPELEAQVERLMGWLQPDAVHWNNIEGFSIGCVDAVKRATGGKARNIFSLHNYHTICPQVYLLQGHRVLCTNFDNGHNCTNCIPTRPPEETRREMVEKYKRSRVSPERDQAVKDLRQAFGWTVKGLLALHRYVRAAMKPVSPLHGHPVDTAADVTRPALPAGGAASDQRGKTPYLMAELNPPPPPDPNSPDRRVVLNVIEPEPASSKPLNEYGQRRQAMVKMLSGCDRVLAVSNFVRHKFVSMGVKPETIRTLPIGSRINRVIALKPDLLFDPPPFDPPPTPWQKQRPIRLHFMGYNNHYKGLPILAEVLETMSPEHLRQIKLSIFALDGQSIEWMFRRLEPRLAGGVGGLQFATGYNFHDIPWMMGGRDICLVPSVWWDNAPQTVFESLACGVPVLGAAVGGIPDFVIDGHNGLLFRANDRDDLKRRLIEIIENPWLLEKLRRNVRPCKSIEEHTREMERVYAGDDEAIYDAAYSPWNAQGQLFAESAGRGTGPGPVVVGEGGKTVELAAR